MNFIYILLLISSLIHCADNTMIADRLPDGMWGANDYVEYTPNIQLTEPSELIKQEVMNPFWLNMKNSCQKKKDEAFFKVLKYFFQYPYSEVRKNVAAAAWSGANLQKEQFLSSIVEKNDIPLVHLLFQQDPSIQTKDSCERYSIFKAITVAMAHVLIEHEPNNICFQNLKSEFNDNTLLHEVMQDSYEPELISLYRSRGVSPLTTNRFQQTPLLELIQYDDKNTIKKATLLLTGLTPAQKVALIWTNNQNRKTIFDLILISSKKTRYVDALEIFLKKTVQQAVPQIEYPEECVICLEQLKQKSNTLYLTPCCHIFHQKCLDPWTQQGSSITCPCCRRNLTYATIIDPADFYVQ